MSIAVAADIKNCPNADSMNPVNWIIEAAILDVPLKQSWHQCHGVMKWQRLSSCLSLCTLQQGTGLIRCLPKIFTSLCPSFRKWWQWEFPPFSNKGCGLTFHRYFPIILGKQNRTVMVRHIIPLCALTYSFQWHLDEFFISFIPPTYIPV